MKNSLIRKIVMTAILTTIVFVQEELLTFLPNVQLTALLFMIYGAYCGMFWGSIIVVAHVMLDCLYMGSLQPFVIIPMMVGWEVVLTFGYLFRKNNIYIKAIVASVGVIIYSWCFIITDVIFLEVSFYTRFITDIVFEIILVASTAISIIWIYVPLFKLLKKKDMFEIN